MKNGKVRVPMVGVVTNTGGENELIRKDFKKMNKFVLPPMKFESGGVQFAATDISSRQIKTRCRSKKVISCVHLDKPLEQMELIILIEATEV